MCGVSVRASFATSECAPWFCRTRRTPKPGEGELLFTGFANTKLDTLSLVLSGWIETECAFGSLGVGF